MTNFVLVEELGIRPGLDGDIDAIEAVENNHDVSLRIDEAQKNSISFEEMGISKWAKVSSIVSSINRLHTLRRSLMERGTIEKVAR